MRRYGVTTVACWLVEELPEGVRSYIEENGKLHELVGIDGTSGHLRPRLRAGLRGRLFINLRSPTRLAMTTPVILSRGERLAGKSLATISSQIGRAALGSHAPSRNEALDGATV